MALIDADCGQCTPTAAVPMTAKCGERLTAGKEAILLFYNCSITKTNDWATVEDLNTDITAGTDVVAIQMTEYAWTGDAPEVVTKGSYDIPVSRTYTLNATSLNRQADNTDYDFWNAIYDWSRDGVLRVATLSKNNDLRDYNPFVANANGLVDAVDSNLELWQGPVVLKSDISGGAGGWALKPVRLAATLVGSIPAYNSVLANAATYTV